MCFIVLVVYGINTEYAAGVVRHHGGVHYVAIGKLQSVGHEPRAGIYFTLAAQRSLVDAVEFGDFILLVGVEAVHSHAGIVVVVEVLGLIPEEYGMVAGLVNIHQSCHTVAVVRRVQTVLVAHLYGGAYGLVCGYGIFAEDSLGLCHL